MSDNQFAIIENELNKRKDKYLQVLPSHIPPERFIRIALTAVANNPDLLDCDRNSFYSACMTAAQLGLVTDSVLGQAYMIPFKKKVQLIPGYRGLQALAFQTGLVSIITARTVYENDLFEIEYGLDQDNFRHVPTKDEPGDIAGFYAVARLRDGGAIFEYMTKEEVDAIRKRNGGPLWSSHYKAMGEKTVLRRLCSKRLPLSTENNNAVERLNRATMIDDQLDAGNTVEIDENGEVIVKEHEETEPQEKVKTTTDSKMQAFSITPEPEIVDAEVVTPEPETQQEPVDNVALGPTHEPSWYAVKTTPGVKGKPAAEEFERLYREKVFQCQSQLDLDELKKANTKFLKNIVKHADLFEQITSAMQIRRGEVQ